MSADKQLSYAEAFALQELKLLVIVESLMKETE